MRVVILGAGRIAQSVLFFTLRYIPKITAITVVDMNEEKLKQVQCDFSWAHQKVTFVQSDLTQQAHLVWLLKDKDLIISALPWAATRGSLELAYQYTIPMFVAARPPHEEYEKLKYEFANNRKGTVVLGCGLEPGLTEILSMYLVELFDTVQQLDIRCGGLPLEAQPPLYYKLLYGDRLPVDDRPTYAVKQGSLIRVPRFSEAETFSFAEYKRPLEAWHDGMLPPFAEKLIETKGALSFSQKTIRWAGFSACVNMLRSLGLLNEKPQKISGVMISPRMVIETLLRPLVVFDEKDRDIVTRCSTLLSPNFHGKLAA